MTTQQFTVQHSVLDEGDAAHVADKTYGVVFVHGIGSQTQSSTLREQADPLIRWLRKWHADATPPPSGGQRDRTKEFAVVWSLLSYGARIDGPARLSVHIPAYVLPAQRRQAAAKSAQRRKSETGEKTPEDHRGPQFGSQNWILTEGWWAARLTAPSFPVMLRWSALQFWRALNRLVNAFLAQDPTVVYDEKLGREQHAPRPPLARAIEWISGLLVIALYTVVGFLGMGAIWILYLIAQIPIPGLESFVVLKLIRPLLLEGVGDVFTYLHDEPQALHVRRSLEEAVTWLVDQEKCDHVIVVAHSGGTPIAFDTLGNRGGAPCKHDVDALAKVKALVTVGSALNNALSSGVGPIPPLRLRDSLCEHTKWIDIWASYDLVAGGKMDPSLDPPRKADEDVRVTNSLSVLLDHGGYWENFEEYLPRIAQLIESPHDRHLSRFWDPLRTEWSERRRDRVTTLVGWRLTAFALFGLALLLKIIERRSATDGSLLLDFAVDLPVVGGALKGFKDAVSGAPEFLKAIGPDVVGILFWAAISAVAYIAVVRVVFEPWADREGLRSVYPPGDPPRTQGAEIAERTAAVIVALAALALGVYAANLADLTLGLALIVGGVLVLWQLAWLKYGRRLGITERQPTRASARAVDRQS